MTTEVKVTEADRQAALKFVRDWDGSDSIRHALAALLAQTRLAERERIVAWAHEKAELHHRYAADPELKHLRVQHIALSSSAVSLAEWLESGDHEGEGR